MYIIIIIIIIIILCIYISFPSILFYDGDNMLQHILYNVYIYIFIPATSLYAELRPIWILGYVNMILSDTKCIWFMCREHLRFEDYIICIGRWSVVYSISVMDDDHMRRGGTWHVGALAHSPLGLQWMSGIVINDSDLQKSTPNHKSGCVSEGRNVAALRGSRYM